VVRGGDIGHRESLETSDIVKLYLEVAGARIGTLLIAPEDNMTLFQICVKDQHLIDTAFALLVEVNNCKSLFHADCQTLTWQNARCPGVNDLGLEYLLIVYSADRPAEIIPRGETR
jgi:hypothetical protein